MPDDVPSMRGNATPIQAEEEESMPVSRLTRSSKLKQMLPSYNPANYPELPVDATPEKYLVDKEAARWDNTRDEFITTDRDMASLCKGRQDVIAKSRVKSGR